MLKNKEVHVKITERIFKEILSNPELTMIAEAENKELFSSLLSLLGADQVGGSEEAKEAITKYLTPQKVEQSSTTPF